MTTEIQKFDPSKLMDGVRDRIKATFVSLIPDDQWENLVKKEVDDFFREEPKPSYYENKGKFPSQFKQIVWNVLEEKCKEQLKEFLLTYSSQIWSNNKLQVNEDFKKLLIDNAHTIFANTLGQMMQQVVNSMYQQR